MGISSTAEALLLGAACCLPCLSLIGKEALMAGGRKFSIPTVGLLIYIAQLAAIVRPHSWPPTFAAPLIELSALWQSGSLSYIVVSGLLRVSLLVLIRTSSASMPQLVNAMAVPLGIFFTPGLEPNAGALPLALGGASLYLLGRPQRRLAKAERSVTATKITAKKYTLAGQRESFMDELE